jgi:hypothetical protein
MFSLRSNGLPCGAFSLRSSPTNPAQPARMHAYRQNHAQTDRRPPQGKQGQVSQSAISELFGLVNVGAKAGSVNTAIRHGLINLRKKSTGSYEVVWFS